MANTDNPRIGREFESVVCELVKAYFKQNFTKQKIFVGNPSKLHEFDLVSEDETVVIECKAYTYTSGNNNPSAKFMGLNEAVLYLTHLPREKKKIIAMIKSHKANGVESLAEYYIRRYDHLLDDIIVLEVDIDNRNLKAIRGKI